MRLETVAILVGALACTPSSKDDTPAPDDAGTDSNTTDTIDCDANEDADADGLDDCTEAELGTDPTNADSDGDGLTDAEEQACVSDPLDGNEQCYACGWAHNDPGTLQASGNEVGDTIANLTFVDQCEDNVSVWDFAGTYTIAFMTAAWCPLCKEEAAAVQQAVEDLEAQTGQPMAGFIVLYESTSAGTPSVDDAVYYEEDIGTSGIPVMADVSEVVLDAVPYDGRELPGICVLSPELEIVHCGSGNNQFPGLGPIILEHAGG